MSDQLLKSWQQSLKILKKSSAQVAVSVAQTVRQKSGELKLKVEKTEKSKTLGIRFQSEELVIVRTKAALAGCTTNSYIRAAALGSNYKPPINPDLRKSLLLLNRELTSQGNNLNQIAKMFNRGEATPVQALAMLDTIRVPLVRALLALKHTLTQGAAQP